MGHWKDATVGGVVSGLVLGFLFKGMEAIFGLKVYTLLLNVDYIPGLNQFVLSERIEIGLHLIVSVVAAACLFWLASKVNANRTALLLASSMAIGVLLYPTTALSERTPALSDGAAFAIWIVGHLVYGAVLSLFYRPQASHRH